MGMNEGLCRIASGKWEGPGICLHGTKMLKKFFERFSSIPSPVQHWALPEPKMLVAHRLQLPKLLVSFNRI